MNILRKFNSLYRRYKQTNHLQLRLNFAGDASLVRKNNLPDGGKTVHTDGTVTVSLLDALGALIAASVLAGAISSLVKIAVMLSVRGRCR